MNQIDNPLRVMADLQPVSLDRMAEEGYARRRAGDLARVMAGHGDQPHGGRRGPALRARGRRRLIIAAATGLTAVAVAAAVVIAASPAPGRPAVPATGAPRERLDARTVLLASAQVAAHAPATTGAYWYVRERDFGSTSDSKKQMFGAYYAATQETWVGQTRTRNTANEDVTFGFASAADEASWRAAGSPKLASQYQYSRTPLTMNYDDPGGHWIRALGNDWLTLTLADARNFPATAAGLESAFRRYWNSRVGQYQAGKYREYLFEIAGAVAGGPVMPGTRAAAYRVLATQPYLTVAPDVTDPLGRTGVAIGDGSGDYIVIDPATARLLDNITSYDSTHYPVRPGTAIRAAGGNIAAYEATGWTNQLGGTPASS